MEKLNLQLFANDEETQTEETQEQTETKEFDIQAILNNPEFVKHMESYADKRVTGALSKKEKEYQAKLEEEKRKANLSVEELQTEKERELAERETTLKQYELKLSKLDYFKEKGYNIDLLDYVSGNDEEEIKANTDKLVGAINKVVETLVQERLKNSSYTPPKGDDKGKVTMEDLSNMCVDDINKLWDKVK